MATDSATELLFSIGADTSHADANLHRFRSLMGSSLDDVAGEFGDWSARVFGDVSKFGVQLQAMRNSQGWQGVFGAEFAQLLKGNEAALKEWATSANQGMTMVQLSLAALDGIGREAFEHLSEGMGRNIAAAIVYSKSIGDAMRSALAATLESIAAESLVQAIYSVAFGFLCLAQGNFAGAESAFTAAAIFGSVGGAAAVAGRAAVGPQRNAPGTAAGGHSGAPSTSGWANASNGAEGSAGGPHVTVNVMGHVFGVSGVQQLASALNDAVLNQDVTLTATNTKTGVQVTR
jgi:hypothetical protein